METNGRSDESDQQKLADHGAGGQTSLAGLDGADQCPTCDGHVSTRDSCPDCDGTGRRGGD